MLPVQNKRLYDHQIALRHDNEYTVVSLPMSYVMTDYDKKRLEALSVNIVFVPDNLSLGESVVYVLNYIGKYDQPLKILHGDTLFSELPVDVDVYSVAQAEDAYDWASANQNGNRVYSGFFSFSNQSLLIQKITEHSYMFIQGIESYALVKKVYKQECPNWMDFSLVNTYYRSVSRMTTQRVFNSMTVSRYCVRKSSEDKQKMKAEAYWLSSLPSPMKHYAPAIWDCGENEKMGYYEMEYYYLSSLANLFVFGNNKTYVWKEIIDSCIEFLNEEAAVIPENIDITTIHNDYLYGIKTLKRLEEYSVQSGISLDVSWKYNGQGLPSLRQIAQETDFYIPKHDSQHASLMHGDFCFSNIMYDFKSKSIKVIDPRGLDNDGNISIYGDLRYDVAKLAHSIIGLYDYIIAGMFDYVEETPYEVSLSFDITDNFRYIQQYFTNQKIAGYTLEDMSTMPIMIQLFLSMLPLHRDNPLRQKAMLANALRLYADFKKLNE